MTLLVAQAIDRLASRGAVKPLVGDVLLPPPDLGVGSDDIELQTGLLEPRRQRHVERAAQIAVEAFNLAFGASAVWAAQFDDETAVLGVVEKSSMVAVLSRTIDIAFQDNGLHAVEQQALGNAAERDERLLMALDQRSDSRVANEFDVAAPAPFRNRTTGSAGSAGRIPCRNDPG